MIWAYIRTTINIVYPFAFLFGDMAYFSFISHGHELSHSRQDIFTAILFS